MSRAGGEWLQTDGSWSTTFNWLQSVVETTGVPSTPWSLGLNLPVGNYGMTAQAVDLANKVDLDRPFVDFSVVAARHNGPHRDRHVADVQPGAALRGGGLRGHRAPTTSR